MKLKKLVVKNLASIEEAAIDFAEGPLAGENLFLICGETGSGKTTLLDAVCLALYGKTPRFDVQRKTKKGEEPVSVGGFRADDVLQLVRRGAGEALAELSFRGNDGHDYVARWVAEAYRRGPNKGRVRTRSRTWTDLSDHERVIDKEGDIQERAAVAIGLDFQQFLRTTMLAQGEFTRFLHADDDEKAAILEKLTDTSRFSAIGAAIYARNKAKQEAVTALDRELEGKKPLEAGKKAELEDEAARLREENARDAAEAASGAARSAWLRRTEELEAAVQSLEAGAEEARKARNSEEVLAAGRDVADWEASAAAREAWKKRNEAETTEEEAAGQLAAWRGDYAALLGARAALGTQRDQTAAALAAEQAALERDAPLAETYARSGGILANLEQIRKDRAAAGASEKRRDELRAGLPALEEALARARADEAAAKAALAAKSREIEASEADLRARGEAELRKTRDNVVARLADIGRARDAATAADNAERDAAAADKKLAEACVALEEEAGKTAGLETAAGEASRMLAAAEESLEAAEALVSDKVQLVVRHLHAGDACPICGGTIREPRSTDEYRRVCETTRKCRDEARTASDNAESALKANAANLKAARKLLETAENNAKEAILKRKEAGKILAAALQKAGVDAPEGLESAETAANAEKAYLETQIAACEASRKAIDELRAEEKELRDTAENATAGTAEADKALDAQKNGIQAAGTAAETSRNAAEELLARVRSEVKLPDWEQRWNASPENFEDALRREAEAHAEHVRERDRLQGELRGMDGELRDADEALEDIGMTVHEWSGTAPAEGAGTERLAARLNDLRKKASAAADRREQARRAGKAAREALAAAREVREDFTDARLETLAGLSENIAELRERVQEATERVTRAEVALEAKRSDLAAHGAARPSDLAEGDTPDALDARVAELRAAQSEREGRLGAIGQMLDDDARLAEERRDLLRQRAEAAGEAALWDGLNAKLGDPDGKKLRRILEAHVLKDVLERANGHLRRLAPRYALSCEGLTVTVIDADQADAERPARTLSGGEQFLVSLALALGLAGLNDRGLAVDMLFVDEGFGTLGGDSLEAAIATLQNLGAAAGGRKVGIISHVAALRERIPAHVEVTRLGEGRSAVRVVART